MWIMIAGPHASGVPSQATEAARQRSSQLMNKAAYEIFQKGHVPVIGANMALPVIEAAGQESYDEIMMPVSLALAARCDAVLRMEGACAAADAQVERVRAIGGTVFRRLDDIPRADATYG
jgi:hypothetical protein